MKKLILLAALTGSLLSCTKEEIVETPVRTEVACPDAPKMAAEWYIENEYTFVWDILSYDLMGMSFNYYENNVGQIKIVYQIEDENDGGYLYFDTVIEVRNCTEFRVVSVSNFRRDKN